MRHTRSWAPHFVLFLVSCTLSSTVFSQHLTLPADYGIDLQLAEVGRSHIMVGNTEITGTAANETGDEVFHRLVGGIRSTVFKSLCLVDIERLELRITGPGESTLATPFAF